MPEPPPNPNLEHLKKQAKALLHDWRQKVPRAIEKFSALQLKTAPKLSDAQHLIAREYGFDSWAKLKKQAELLAAPNAEVWQQARRAFQDDDAAAFRRLLERYPGLKATINEPVADFDSPLINHVRSRAMLDVLLDAGADINARSRWWAGEGGRQRSSESGPPTIWAEMSHSIYYSERWLKDTTLRVLSPRPAAYAGVFASILI